MNKEFDFPPVRDEIDPKNYHIDGTPDGRYALRILRFYRELCNCKWVVNGMEDNEKLIYDLMNVHQDQRALELDDAIKILTIAKNGDSRQRS